jgi:hypothetical protein
MRGTVRLARGGGLLLTAAVVAGLTGCASPEYRFVGSSQRDVVIKMPRSWVPLDTAAALKASGIDPAAAAATTWTVFYDAAPKPVISHVSSPSTDAPFMFAQTIPISPEQRASVTDDQLRELMLPATPEMRDAAIKAKEFAILTDEKVSKRKQHGMHVRYSYKIGPTIEYYDRIALTDTKRTAVHILFVHCTRECFQAHPEIDDVVTSMTLKSN